MSRRGANLAGIQGHALDAWGVESGLTAEFRGIWRSGRIIP